MKIKWVLIWTFLHALSILIVSYLTDLLTIQSQFVVLLLFGFGVTILANTYRVITRKKKFIINSFFALWVAVNSITIWVFLLISDALNIKDIYLNAILIGVGLVGSSYLVYSLHLLKLKGLKRWIPTLIILGVLFFAHGGLTITVSQEVSGNVSENISVTSGNIIEHLVDSIKGILPSSFELSCPQINVPMEKDYWSGLSIKGKSYDGWTVKGDATCRQGTKEGENLNHYYCGGYTSFFGIGDVNAYIEKTIISDSGDIGKTTKYVIWNMYDENKNFIETRCIGNPDEFDRKQAEAFERELLKWN
jgi:hypothetical protein